MFFGNQNYASQDTSYTEDNQKLRNYTYKSIYTPLKGTNDAYRIKYIIVDSESKNNTLDWRKSLELKRVHNKIS
ncbi:hypothetical protein ACT7CT_24150 [Bacillus sanguinis]